MTGSSNKPREDTRPVSLGARAQRIRGPIILSVLVIGILCASFLLAPSTQHTPAARVLDTSLAGDAICARDSAVVPYGQTVDIYGDEVLVAETPESGTRGMIFRWTIDDGGAGTARGQFAT